VEIRVLKEVLSAPMSTKGNGLSSRAEQPKSFSSQPS